MVYRIDIAQDGGRIWNEKPEREGNGLFSIISHARSASELTRTAFNSQGDVFACLDYVQSKIFVFLVYNNRYYTISDIKGLEVGLAFTFSNHQKNELYVALSGGIVQIYDIEKEKLANTLQGPHRQGVRFISFNKAGTHCATSSDDMLIVWKCGSNSIYDPFLKVRMLDLSKVPQSLLKGQFTHIGGIDVMAVCMQDGSISLWRAADMQLLTEHPAPPVLKSSPSPSYFNLVSVSQDSSHIVIAGNAPVIFVFRIEVDKATKNKHTITFSHHVDLHKVARFVTDVVFLPPIIKPQGYWAVALTDDGVICFLDVGTRTQVSDILLEIPPPPRDIFASFTLSAHGRYLASSTQKGSVYLFDVFSSFHHLHVPNEQATKPAPKLSPRKVLSKAKSTPSPTKPKESPRSASEPTSSLYPVPETDVDASFLSPAGLSHEKILALLRSFGEYPPKYRVLVWKTLLGLPENHDAYSNLLNQGTHFAYTDLHRTLPINNRRLFKRMERNLSLVAHWAPIFGEVQYLPSLIFPFVKLINEDILCFETICTFLVNWCDEWFEFYPHPPIVVLQQIDTLLEIHDHKLWLHFYSAAITSADYAYPLLTTLFSEVLRTEEWLILFDHLVSNPPSFLDFVVIAYLKYFRAALLQTSKEDFEFFIHRINSNDIHHVMRLAYKLRMPNIKDVPETKPFVPLPSGQYPIFNRVPKRRLSHQIREIEKIRREEELFMTKKREEVLQTMQTRM